mgnify:CR=1 FL=1
MCMCMCDAFVYGEVQRPMRAGGQAAATLPWQRAEDSSCAAKPGQSAGHGSRRQVLRGKSGPPRGLTADLLRIRFPWPV